jgi:hypothetical protein
MNNRTVRQHRKTFSARFIPGSDASSRLEQLVHPKRLTIEVVEVEQPDRGTEGCC